MAPGLSPAEKNKALDCSSKKKKKSRGYCLSLRLRSSHSSRDHLHPKEWRPTKVAVVQDLLFTYFLPSLLMVS